MARLALAAHLTDGETEDEGTSWELGKDLDVTSGLLVYSNHCWGEGVRVVRTMDFWYLFLKAEEVGWGRETPPTLMCWVQSSSKILSS